MGDYLGVITLMTEHTTTLQTESDLQYELNYLLLRSYERTSRSYVESGEKRMQSLSISLINEAYNLLALLRKIKPDNFILHDWRKAKIFVLEFEAEQHFKQDMAMRFSELAEKHVKILHSHLKTLGLLDLPTNCKEHIFETFNTISKMKDFSKFLESPEFIINIHITQIFFL